MDAREVAEILLRKKTYGQYSIHKLELVGEKYDCSVKEETGRAKNKYYFYPHRGADTELLAVEGAINHVIKTGGLQEILATDSEVPIEKEKKKKKEKVVKVDEESPESPV